jgi:hypothetical protein
VSNWTAGGWSGSIGSLDNSVQQISEGCKICDRNYNAGTHDGFRIESRVPKHHGWIWSHMCKGQRRKTSGDGDIELSVAQKELSRILGDGVDQAAW